MPVSWKCINGAVTIGWHPVRNKQSLSRTSNIASRFFKAQKKCCPLQAFSQCQYLSPRSLPLDIFGTKLSGSRTSSFTLCTLNQMQTEWLFPVICVSLASSLNVILPLLGTDLLHPVHQKVGRRQPVTTSFLWKRAPYCYARTVRNPFVECMCYDVLSLLILQECTYAYVHSLMHSLT